MRTPRRTSLTAAVALALTATAAGGLAGAGSASGKESSPPGDIVPPTITALQVGQTLTADPGHWGGTGPFTYYYQWIRSDGGDGTPIPGATGPTYTPTNADIGHNLFVQIKAVNSAGHAWANSRYTSVVTGAAAQGAITLPDGRTSVAARTVTLPDRLVVAGADFAPPKIPVGGTVTAKITVADALEQPVHGALVRVVALPFGVLGPVAEATTNAEGIATLTLTATPLLARVPGNAIALSVRARKPGGDVLAGVTAVRLVKLEVSRP